jgi:hypothetical protein
MIRRLSVLSTLLLVVGSPSLAQQKASKKPPVKKAVRSKAADPMGQIAESHVRGNVPAKPKFDKYLRRDLTAFFTRSSGKKVAVDYEFLRDGPTQTGISFPKYYLWVRVRTGKKLIDEGAVRLAAIDQQRFEVTHYLPKAEMKKDPAQIDGLFPLPVGDRIRQKLK